VTLFQRFARDEGAAIVMVTHDNRILDVADRIVNMVDGRIRSNVLVKESRMICEFLQGVPVFAKLTPRTLAHVADQMALEKYPAGTTIIQQGDEGDKFYLIREGTAEVLIQDGDTQRKVTELGPGNFFGEAALMTNEPRNASVLARTAIEVYSLGCDEFQAVLNASASFEEELRKVLFDRQ
jgi:putative ABC transport system ATP-binding protein